MEPVTTSAVFDPAQRRRARLRAYTQFTDDTRFLHDWAKRQIDDRVQDVMRSFTAPLSLQPDILASDTMEREILDADPGSHDLVTANLWLHAINDLPGMLVQIRRALKPDGLFIGAMLGGETLHELRASLQATEMELMSGVSPRIAPFADKQQMGSLMQRAGFALPVVDSDIVTVTYPDLGKLMNDLRGMGESNIIAARAKTIPPRTFFKRAEEIYKEDYQQDGKLVASFEVIFLLGWAPHESQQKPLKPGSAQTRLADALAADEKELPR